MRTVTRTAGYLVAVTLFTAVIGDATAAAQPAYLVRDVNAVEVNDGSGPEQFVVMDDRIYFTATDNQHGEELWTSDGTEDGTELVKDVCPGPCYSRPLGQTVLDHTLYFLAFSGALSSDPQAPRSGSELWKSDGTPQGTERVRKVCSKYCPSYPSLTEIVAVDGHVYFAGHDSALGEELWKSDGTPQGTGPVVDLCPGECSSFPTELRVFAGRLFFRAMDDEHGDELWVSDGSAAGTELVKDICPGECASRPSWLTTLLPDKLLFVADDGVHDKELWMSDGTAAGTVLLADITSEYGIGLTRYARLGEPLYFIASGVPGVWKTDGTPQGTQPAPELMPNGSTPDQWQVVGDRIFFTVRRTLSSAELWVSAGTVAGIRLLDDGFTQLELEETPQLWVSAGTAEGTLALAVFAQFPEHLVELGGTLLFSAFDEATGWALWASDGSPEGTRLVVDPTPEASSEILHLVRSGDRVDFVVRGEQGDQLWRTDGTAAATRPVSELTLDGTGSRVASAAAAGERLFLSVEHDTTGEELWTSGPSARTSQPGGGARHLAPG